MKIYAIIAAFLVVIAAGWGLYRMGGAGCREASANAAREHVEGQNKLLAKLAESNKAKEAAYRDKARAIARVADACTDLPVPAAIRLQLSRDGEKQPTPDP
jgi:hypothetical protein